MRKMLFIFALLFSGWATAASIVSVTITHDSGGSDRRLHYTIVLEDNDSVQSTHEIGPIAADAGFNAPAHANAKAQQLLTGAADDEDSTVVERVASEDSLSIALNPKWSTSKRISKRLIRWMMAERDPRIVVMLEPLLDYLKATYTANQMANWLDITVPQVLKMNRRINAVLEDVGTVKAQLILFDAEHEEIDD